MLCLSPKGSSGDHSFHLSMEYGQFPFPLTSVSQDNLFQERSHSQSEIYDEVLLLHLSVFHVKQSLLLLLLFLLYFLLL